MAVAFGWQTRQPPMSTVTLRPWQRAAFDLFRDSPDPDFLAVATPGAGKTTFALACARRRCAGRAAPVGRGRRRRADQPPQAPVGAGRAPASASSSTPTGRPADGPAARRPRPRHDLPAGRHGDAADALRGLAADGVRHPRRGPPRRRRAGVGRRRARRVRAGRPAPVAVAARRSAATRDAIPFVRYDATARATAPADYSTATPTRCATAASCGPSTSRASTGRWSGARRTAHVLRARRSTTSSTATGVGQRLRTALSLDGEWLPDRARPGPRAAHARSASDAARRRRPGHRHRPGPRPGHRAT